MRRTTLLLLSVALAVAPSAGADGMLDPAFGNGGLVMTAFPGQFSNDTAMSLVMLPDGRAVAAGSTNVNLAFTAMAVARYLTTGALDTTFDGDGLVTVPFIPPGPGIDAFSEARRVLLQPDGRLVLVGYAAGSQPNQSFIALARLNVDGSLDTSFGTCHAVAIAGPDRVLTAGTVKPAGYLGPAFGLARYIITTTVEGPEAGVE
jgi:uncharacterized delta-60 repeat protein